MAQGAKCDGDAESAANRASQRGALQISALKRRRGIVAFWQIKRNSLRRANRRRRVRACREKPVERRAAIIIGVAFAWPCAC